MKDTRYLVLNKKTMFFSEEAYIFFSKKLKNNYPLSFTLILNLLEGNEFARISLYSCLINLSI